MCGHYKSMAESTKYERELEHEITHYRHVGRWEAGGWRTIFSDENYVNKLLIGPKQFFFSVKNHNKFSSQNNIPKYRTKSL